MTSLALTAGIDIGAGTTKAALLEDGVRVVAKASIRTGPNLEKAGTEALGALLRAAGLRSEDLAYVASTGYGRYQMAGRDMQITEITCHGRGARFLFPATHCVLDIGAQSSRAMRIDGNGRVVKFKMNDRCAAGAGRFLERVSKALEVQVADLGEISLRSTDPTTISSICAVLAESEIINHVTEGRKVEDIVMGAHLSIADRIIALLRQVGVEDEVTLTGGLAGNVGMVNALETRLGRHINVAPESAFAGAYGAAVLGHVRLDRRTADGPGRSPLPGGTDPA